MGSRTTRIRVTGVVLVLASGGILVLAGYLAESGDWAVAGLVALAAGVLTRLAFWLGHRSEGVPSKLATKPTVGALVLMQVSGAVMFAAGYVGASEGWLLASPLTLLGGPVIAGSYLLERRARAA